MLFKSKVIIKGSKKDDYIVSVEDKNGTWDIVLTELELQTLYKLLKKKFDK